MKEIGVDGLNLMPEMLSFILMMWFPLIKKIPNDQTTYFAELGLQLSFK